MKRTHSKKPQILPKILFKMFYFIQICMFPQHCDPCPENIESSVIVLMTDLDTKL